MRIPSRRSNLRARLSSGRPARGLSLLGTSLIALSLLASCGTSAQRAQDSSSGGAGGGAGGGEEDERVPCAELSRGACLLSVECQLDRDPAQSDRDTYLCRPAVGVCEHDYPQMAAYETSPASALCERTAGCTFVPMDTCYCGCRGFGRTQVEDGPEAPECDCACAGGEPGGCVPSPADDGEPPGE